MRRAIFLDRDGTLNSDEGYVHKVEHLEILPGVIEGLSKLENDYDFFIITNQSGIGRGIYEEKHMHQFNDALLKELKKHHIEIKKIYFCPHTPEHLCDCRKPHLKFMQQAIKEFDIDVKNSWSIGDHPHDVEMALKAGAKGIYLLTGHGDKHASELEKKGIHPSFIAKDFLGASNFILSQSKTSQNKKTNINKIKTIDEIEKIVNILKKEHKKIVTTNGVFDILHIGHIRYLQEAKSQGDVLIIAVNVDSSVKQNKGDTRPLNNENDRAEQLAALECVDYVMLFSEKTPVEILGKIKPSVHVKGGDYSIDRIIEKNVVEENGGKIVLIPEVKGYSTTKLIDRIIAVYGKK